MSVRECVFGESLAVVRMRWLCKSRFSAPFRCQRMKREKEREGERRRQKEKDKKETQNGRKERRMMKFVETWEKRECVCVCARVRERERERESKEAMRKISFERCVGGS